MRADLLRTGRRVSFMSHPIPFEAFHPQEALFLQAVYADGLAVREDRFGLHLSCPIRLRKRRLMKYRETITWIRRCPDREL